MYNLGDMFIFILSYRHVPKCISEFKLLANKEYARHVAFAAM